VTIQIFGHAKCKGTRAAQRFFSDRRIPVQMIDILQKGLSRGEFDSVVKAVGGVHVLYDAASPRVKERGLQYAQPNHERMTQLLLEDAKLFRTPIVRSGSRAAVGIDETMWKRFAEDTKNK
jgi:arsenate reductase